MLDGTIMFTLKRNYSKQCHLSCELLPHSKYPSHTQPIAIDTGRTHVRQKWGQLLIKKIERVSPWHNCSYVLILDHHFVHMYYYYENKTHTWLLEIELQTWLNLKHSFVWLTFLYEETNLTYVPMCNNTVHVDLNN